MKIDEVKEMKHSMKKNEIKKYNNWWGAKKKNQ